MLQDHGLRVAVLGPLRATVDDRAVEVPGRSLRRLLLRLALARGETVADHALLTDVWGEDAALPVLHTAVARLRRVLEPDRVDRAPGRLLVRDGDGYRLRLHHDGLDVDRFLAAARRGAALVRADRPDEARAALDAARRAWSGTPFMGTPPPAFAAAEAARLDAAHVEADELRLEVAARLGEPLAVAELEAFVLQHPTRERAVALLIETLAAQQRPAEALAALRRARRAVVESTGNDLGPALRGLQAALLRGERLPTRGATTRPSRLLPTTNLPAPLTSLVGREAELAEVDRRLSTARLLVLVGPGGSGKTRLAIEACRRRADQDGPWFADLADLTSGALLPERVGRVLGMGGAGSMEALAAGLRDRTTVLLLDNCELIAATTGQLVLQLLQRCPGLTVLATSREPLGVAGETVLPVAPLSTGPEGDAVRLFVQRAEEVAGRALTPHERDEAVDLCDDLDGLPLAIELAAARANALSVPDLRRALADRFALLRRDGRGGRHATMLAAVEWTFRALDDDEREVLQALAVFRGGFRLEAAQQVAGRSDTALVLARLVSRSVVTVVAGAEPRYRLLETLREQAERTTPPARHDALVERHLAWVRSLASGADSKLRGRLSSTATAELQDEAANIRAALQAAGPADVLRIGGGFYWFWYREGLTEEGLGHLRAAIAATAALPGGADLADRCRAGMGVALLSYLRGDFATVQSALQQAADDAERCGDLRVTTQYLSTRAYFEAGGGAIDAARSHAERSLRLARQTDDRGGGAESLMVLGEVARQAGALADAAHYLDDAVRAATACGYTWARTSSEWIASKVALQDGRPGDAHRLATASALGSQREHETTSLIVGLVTLGHLDLVLGRPARAALLAGAAAWLGSRIGFAPQAMDADLAGWTAALEAVRLERPEDFEAGRLLSAEGLRVILAEESALLPAG